MEYTFWNHVGCLLQRIENNEQNSLEIPPEHGINQEDFILADKMIDTIIFPKLGIEITEFETFLLALYFKIFNKERRES